jgi:hypothetical protein
LEVGGAALRALRLEVKRNDAGTGRKGETAREAEKAGKVIIPIIITVGAASQPR